MLGLRPGHMAQQPAARRGGGEVGFGGLRHCLEVDQPLLQREGPPAGPVKAFEDEDFGRTLEAELLHLASRGGSNASGQELIVVSLAAPAHLGRDVRDVEHGGVNPGPRHERPELATSLNEPGLGKRRERLVHRHA